MNKPNTLLKVVSILHIVLSAIAIVLVLAASTFAGSLVGMLYDWAGLDGAVGAGVLTGTVIFLLAVVGCALNLVAGILGVKGRFTGCKVMGIFLLVCAIVVAAVNLSVYDATATLIVSCVVRLILPVLYVWGAFKGPQAD